MLPPKIGNKVGRLLLLLLFHTGLGALESTIRQEKEIKDIEIRKKEKLSLFLDDMIVYIEVHYPYVIYPPETPPPRTSKWDQQDYRT